MAIRQSCASYRNCIAAAIAVATSVISVSADARSIGERNPQDGSAVLSPRHAEPRIEVQNPVSRPLAVVSAKAVQIERRPENSIRLIGRSSMSNLVADMRLERSGKAQIEATQTYGRVLASRAEANGRFMNFRPLLPALTIGKLPVDGARLTSRFGGRLHPISGRHLAHRGIDMAAPVGTPVKATASGTVSKASWFGGYGLLVELSHGGGLQSRYAHLSRLNVSKGQSVREGETIGFVGSTGRSTGPHLHYELRQNGRAVNPLGPRSN